MAKKKSPKSQPSTPSTKAEGAPIDEDAPPSELPVETPAVADLPAEAEASASDADADADVHAQLKAAKAEIDSLKAQLQARDGEISSLKLGQGIRSGSSAGKTEDMQKLQISKLSTPGVSSPSATPTS
eukprot:gene21632-28639_t